MRDPPAVGGCPDDCWLAAAKLIGDHERMVSIAMRSLSCFDGCSSSDNCSGIEVNLGVCKSMLDAACRHAAGLLLQQHAEETERETKSGERWRSAQWKQVGGELLHELDPAVRQCIRAMAGGVFVPRDLGLHAAQKLRGALMRVSGHAARS